MNIKSAWLLQLTVMMLVCPVVVIAQNDVGDTFQEDLAKYDAYNWISNVYVEIDVNPNASADGDDLRSIRGHALEIERLDSYTFVVGNGEFRQFANMKNGETYEVDLSSRDAGDTGTATDSYFDWDDEVDNYASDSEISNYEDHAGDSTFSASNDDQARWTDTPSRGAKGSFSDLGGIDEAENNGYGLDQALTYDYYYLDWTAINITLNEIADTLNNTWIYTDLGTGLGATLSQCRIFFEVDRTHIDDNIQTLVDNDEFINEDNSDARKLGEVEKEYDKAGLLGMMWGVKNTTKSNDTLEEELEECFEENGNLTGHEFNGLCHNAFFGAVGEEATSVISRSVSGDLFGVRFDISDFFLTGDTIGNNTEFHVGMLLPNYVGVTQFVWWFWIIFFSIMALVFLILMQVTGNNDKAKEKKRNMKIVAIIVLLGLLASGWAYFLR